MSTPYIGTYGSRVKRRTPHAYLQVNRGVRRVRINRLRSNLFGTQLGAGGSVSAPRYRKRGFRTSHTGQAHSKGRVTMSKKKIPRRARGARMKPRLKELMDKIEPVIAVEENFKLSVASGASAPPLTAGSIGLRLMQLMKPTGVGHVFPNTYPTTGLSTLGSQLVEQQCFYDYDEQFRLWKYAAQHGTALNIAQQAAWSDPNVSNTVFNTNFNFNFMGATVNHTFVNTGVTQCNFVIYEWQPRRFLDITINPIWAWNQDLSGGNMGPVANLTTMPPYDDTGLRDYRVLGQRPSKAHCPTLYYNFKCLSKREISIAPGQEYIYKQKFAPYVMTSEFLRISSTSGNTPTQYNTKTRFMMVIGYGEKGVFTNASIANSSVLAAQSWQVAHLQQRYASFRITLPGRKFQRIVVDQPNNPAFAFTKETDVNEEQDDITSIQAAAGVADVGVFQMI